MHITTETSESFNLLSTSGSYSREPNIINPEAATSTLRSVSAGTNHVPAPSFSGDYGGNYNMIQDTGLATSARIQRMNCLYTWGWEIGACIGSLVGFCAIVGLLIAYDGMSQPSWPYGITLNSATSFLVTLTKGFLLLPAASCISQSMWNSYSQGTQRLDNVEVYDAASRGPWGALQLLGSFRVRSLACPGALLTILAMGIDPTVQQTILVQTRHVESALATNLPRAQSFTQYDTSIADAGVGDFQPTVGLAGLAYTGIFFNSSLSGRASLDVVPTCPTGNCTFPEFQSLAVCSTCRNITYAVDKQCSEYSRVDGNDTTTWTLCTFSLPNGLQFNMTTMVSSAGPANHSDYEGETIAATALLPLVDATDYGGSKQMPTFTNLSAPYNYGLDAIGGSFLNITVLNGTASYDQMTAHASQCSLQWCVNTYQANVTNGVLTERLVRSWRNASAQWDPDESYAGPVYTGYRPMELMTPKNNSTQQASNFIIFSDPQKILSTWLSQKFTFSDSRALIARQNTKDTSYYYLTDVSSTFQSIPGGIKYLTPYLDLRRNLRMSGVAEVSTNLAKAITTYLRTLKISEQEALPPFSSDRTVKYEINGAGPATGTSYSLEVYIEIRWAWMAFLGAVLVLTILLFVLVVAQSARHNVAVWKSSPLALMFHGPESSKHQPVDLQSIAEMERYAKTLEVRLADTGSGMRFKEQ